MAEDLMNLRKFVAPEFIYGPGARSLAGNFIARLGVNKVMVVSDPGVQKAGWVDGILASLSKAQVSYIYFDEVSPNPRDYQVMLGAEIYRREHCEAIVAVGGGSPMDLAKGVGIVVSNNRHVLDFEGIDQVEIPSPPLVCIPTTAGSSADVSQFAIINDSKRKIKIAIVSKAVVPDMALIDPETTLSMDPELTAATAMDALTHAVEAYVSRAAFSITDTHALQAISLVRKNILKSVKAPGNPEYRDKLMLGSLHAGLAFSNAILGAVHALAHSLGGLMDFPHGMCNALLLSHVVRFNFDSSADRYVDIARAMGIQTSGLKKEHIRDSLCDEIVDLHFQAGLTRPLGEMGLKKEFIPELARNALNDPCMLTNPKTMSESDVQKILLSSI
ncbi:alcohol dehydrogenase-like regulatory protein ErcA [Desulfonatronovibrio hydrogenovorans]|uniref:alcohol dehydrogenase-like regulatory protein ErcA n=1 Tax=Desulfonatronovibrio hydrogenovorans TaxID=53245 RepID=UPI00048D617E|nr:alcohol dehydrogenase-like regulatory protein ErcA [Desulfonatronovibrio hydrogenovorans]